MQAEERHDFPLVGARARCLNRFERDFERWLQTPEGRFAKWHAERVVATPPRSPRTAPDHDLRGQRGEARLASRSQHAGRADLRLDVGDRATAPADQVVVVVRARVVDDRAALGGHALDEPELPQQLQRRVDGGEGDARHQLADLVVDLLRRDVPLGAPDDPRDAEPLRGHALPARTQGGGEGGLDGGRHGAGV